MCVVNDYSGPMNHKVFEFIDALRPHPERENPRNEIADYSKPQLPHNPDKEIGRLCMAYYKKLFSDKFSNPEKDKLEREFILEMKTKYPHMTWIHGRKANFKSAAAGERE